MTIRPWHFILVCIAAAAIGPAATADTLYTYTGNNYTSCYGASYAPSCWNYAITGSFVTTTALGANLNDQVVNPTSFSLSDGSMTLTQSNSVTSHFEVSTDAIGNITAWSVNATVYSIYFASGYEYGAYETLYSDPTQDWAIQDSYYTYFVPYFFPDPVYCDATQSYSYECGGTTYQGSSLSGASNGLQPGFWVDPPMDPTPTPESSSALMLGVGLLGMALFRGAKKRIKTAERGMLM